MKIDAHNHFWNYDPQKHSWINDDMSVIKRDFTPADLKEQLESTGLEGTIAVQADQSEAETDFLLDLAQHNEFIIGVVGWVDLRANDIEERLAHYAANPKLKGVRHVVQDEPDPDFMLGDQFQKGLSLLKRYNLTYDILIFPTQFKAAIQTVKNHPEQKFVVDHIAKPYIKSGEIGKWEDDINEIAQYDHVMCKLSGMVTEANWDTWQYEDFVPYLDRVMKAFGTNRVMYGSDWPVCLLGGKYNEVKGVLDQYFENYSELEQKKIFGENALSFYGIK